MGNTSTFNCIVWPTFKVVTSLFLIVTDLTWISSSCDEELFDEEELDVEEDELEEELLLGAIVVEEIVLELDEEILEEDEIDEEVLLAEELLDEVLTLQETSDISRTLIANNLFFI